MLEAAFVGLRLAQYLAVALLAGTPLFLLCVLPVSTGGRAPAWASPTLVSASWILGAGAALGFFVQTAMLAGDMSSVTPTTLGLVAGQTELGRAAVLRMVVAAAGLPILILGRKPRLTWMLVAGLGLAACASFAWSGHGLASEGAAHAPHLMFDIIHLWAAAAWLGALAAFLLLACAPRPGADDLADLHRALARFSGIGSLLVAALVVTGLANSLFLIGVDRLSALWTTSYGLVLIAKLAAFAGMVVLAAINRFRLTPALAREPAGALPALRRSLFVEAGLGVAVVALVAVLGTLPPPIAL